ncbi:protein of unknown function [Sterolibacterium denitrificans]|uniref:Uncharacterized protein n=1 Tax=Sterolibacterium denitrificans TaxID=157592 RepID=A0A7Z7HQV6_9PROT|nr:protein of unknown function [Sterolibacterium denitrificans]
MPAMQFQGQPAVQAGQALPRHLDDGGGRWCALFGQLGDDQGGPSGMQRRNPQGRHGENFAAGGQRPARDGGRNDLHRGDDLSLAYLGPGRQRADGNGFGQEIGTDHAFAVDDQNAGLRGMQIAAPTDGRARRAMRPGEKRCHAGGGRIFGNDFRAEPRAADGGDAGGLQHRHIAGREQMSLAQTQRWCAVVRRPQIQTVGEQDADRFCNGKFTEEKRVWLGGGGRHAGVLLRQNLGQGTYLTVFARGGKFSVGRIGKG